MSSCKAGQRVEVYSGDGSVFLGEGTFVGLVEVYVFPAKGLLFSMYDAENKPSQEVIDFYKNEGVRMEVVPDNPKIILDDGTVEYGCQVWWKEK